jgi:tetratricopeptide (TPR) repeat protein
MEVMIASKQIALLKFINFMKHNIFLSIAIISVFFQCTGNNHNIDSMEKRAVELQAMYSDNIDSLNLSRRIFEEIYSIDSTYISNIKHLISIYTTLGEDSSAYKKMRRLLRLDNNDAEGKVALGVYFERHNELDSAKKYFSDAYNAFVQRGNMNKYKGVLDQCDAAYMIILLENDTTKAIHFIESLKEQTDDPKAIFLYNEAKSMIRRVDRQSYIDNFGRQSITF